MTDLRDELKAMEGRLSEKRATHHAQSCRYTSPRGKRGPKFVWGRWMENGGKDQENKASSVDRGNTLE